MKMTSQKIILIVEDNEINRIMLRGILEPQYKVLEAQNGLEALKVLGDQKDNVSLILLDIMMPVMNEHLTKPLNCEKLIATIVKFL